MRKILIIVGAIVVVSALVGTGAWFALREEGTTQPPNNETPNNGLPSAENGNNTTPTDPTQNGTLQTADFGIVADVPVIDYVVDETNIVFLVTPNGSVLQVVEGATTELVTLSHAPVVAAKFSPDTTKLLYAWEGANNQTRWGVFDKESLSDRELDVSVSRPDWSPDGQLIAYFDTSGTYYTVSVLDVSTEQPVSSSVMSFSAPNLALSWISSNSIILSEPPTAQSEGSVWRLDVSRETISRIITAPGALVKWDPGSDQGLLFRSEAGGRGGDFSLINGNGEAVWDFLFNTLPVKCAFEDSIVSDRSIVCGVPRNANVFSNQTLPDEYFTHQYLSTDDIIRVTLSDASIDVLLSQSSTAVDVSSPVVVGDTFFFVDRRTNRLYGLNISE